MKLDIKKAASLGSYIQVLAQINDKANVEYLSYKLFNLSQLDKTKAGDEENKHKSEDEGSQSPNTSNDKSVLKEWISNNTIPFIIILSILGTILILVIILLIYD